MSVELKTARRFNTLQFLLFLFAYFVLVIGGLHAWVGYQFHIHEKLALGLFAVGASIATFVFLRFTATEYQYDPNEKTKWEP